jgi:ribosomal protein S18 acetylase RimI-like enzyme
VFEARDFGGDDDLRLMQRVVAAAWQAEKPLVRFHVGDLAWARYQHAGREHEWRVRLWQSSVGKPVGWAWLYLPGYGEFLVVPEHRPRLVPEILDWLAAHADGDLSVSVLDADDATMRVLLDRGFRRDGGPTFEAMVLPLGAPLPAAGTPHGYRVRHMEGDADVPERAAVHCAAFSVFAPSRVTTESYRNVIAAWPYRKELDWVVEAPDGSFASFCLAWLDEDNRVGELEPVGTDPAHRRRGLGRAVCTAALNALREHGADSAVVYAREVEGRPSAPALYRALGFTPQAQHVTLTARTSAAAGSSRAGARGAPSHPPAPA